ncbi:hypothetical protein [Chitinophaga alhagiae]|uniref:hypothetical protein n=1 Tax=Chitinophaga alhagiae TaxID=2203219 RepID=UPI000E5A9EBE|nr:hypothetical protein [Chitinophaga alhagiae]
MKKLLKLKALDLQAAAGIISRPKPWVAALVKRLEKLERRLTYAQKHCWLFMFTVAAGAYFLYVAIAGISASSQGFIRQQPPKRIVPIFNPPPALVDSTHFKNALP